MRPSRAERIGENVMGIFGALTTAVGGLRAQSYALENVSGNIANSQTTAFKRIDTSFLDLVPQTSVTQQLAGGVTTQSRSTNSVQGDVQTASVATFMAINGAGFFAVQKPGTFTDGAPVFDGVDRYTRRGDFQLGKNGFLVNGAGYYLEGVPIDPTTGNPSGSSPQVLQFQNDFLPAQETTKIDYRANLASYPLTTNHDTSVPGSELIQPTSFSSGHNPLALGTPAPFIDNSTSGTAQSNKAAAPNTGAIKLSGVAGSDSIGTNFAAGDTITVNGTVVTFVASGATGNQLNVTDSVQALLAKIDSISGTTSASTINGGAITLHGGSGTSITLTSSNATAFAALGFGATVTANPAPLRVAGPPFATATTLVAGTSANTVSWYTGESGPDLARGTAVARVDQSITVQYGARADEQALRYQLQNIAVYAVLTTNAGNPNANA